MLTLKKAAFFIVLFIPALLLLGAIVSISIGIYKIRRIDYESIRLNLKGYLEKEKGKASVTIKDEILYLDYSYYIKNGPYKPNHRQFSIKAEGSDYLIYIYGPSFLSSSPPFFKGDFPFFPLVLEAKLNTHNKNKFRVVNFGIEGLDSFDVKEIIKETVKCRKPNLIIYYDLSAADFECAYFTCIKKDFYLVTGFLKKISGLFILKQPLQVGRVNQYADWFLRAYVEPILINLAQQFNIIKIEKEPFLQYNELIASYYRQNISEIIKFTQNKNIPLVMISSVSNLESRPYGIYPETDKLYGQGMKEKEYFRRIDYLTRAKDSEIFSGELVIKSEIYTFLRSIEKKNVYLFDLQKKLVDRKFGFSYRNFYDYGHMNPDSHKLIADYLYEFLIQNEDISAGFPSQ